MDTYIYTSYIDTLLKGVLRIIFLLNGVFSVIKQPSIVIRFFNEVEGNAAICVSVGALFKISSFILTRNTQITFDSRLLATVVHIMTTGDRHCWFR